MSRRKKAFEERFIDAEKYDPKYHPIVCAAMRNAGAIMKHISSAFHISDTQLKNWIKRYPELKRAYEDAGNVCVERVSEALLKSALGFMGPDGKYYRPDITAMIFYLKNRDRENWRDVYQGENVGSLRVEVVDFTKAGEQGANAKSITKTADRPGRRTRRIAAAQPADETQAG